jgi:hypothetical protein
MLALSFPSGAVANITASRVGTEKDTKDALLSTARLCCRGLHDEARVSKQPGSSCS